MNLPPQLKDRKVLIYAAVAVVGLFFLMRRKKAARPSAGPVAVAQSPDPSLQGFDPNSQVASALSSSVAQLSNLAAAWQQPGAGGASGSPVAPAPTPTPAPIFNPTDPSSIINADYQALLHHSADQAAYDYWLPQIAAHGAQQVYGGIAGSPEARVQQVFTSDFGRLAAGPGLGYWEGIAATANQQQLGAYILNAAAPNDAAAYAARKAAGVA